MLTQEHLKILKTPFPENVIGVKVQSTNHNKNTNQPATKAMLVLYAQHTDVADRLEEVDLNWTASYSVIKAHDKLVVVECKLTVLGVTRSNVGEGNDEKAAYSDAFKRAAMQFGVCRYLYDSETVWVDYNDSMKYKQWTYADYKAALASKPKPYTPQAPVMPTKPTQIHPSKQVPPTASKQYTLKDPTKRITQNQINLLKGRGKANGWLDHEIESMLQKHFHASFDSLAMGDMDQALSLLEQTPIEVLTKELDVPDFSDANDSNFFA